MPADRIDKTRIDNLGDRAAGTEAKVEMINEDVREIFRLLSDIKDAGNAADNDQNQRISKLEDSFGTLKESLDKKTASQRTWAIAIITAVIGGLFAIVTTLMTIFWSSEDETSHADHLPAESDFLFPDEADPANP